MHVYKLCNSVKALWWQNRDMYK